MTIKFDGTTDYNNIEPTVYRIIVKGLATKSTSQIEKFATFTVTLSDICDPPVSVTKASLIDQTFNIEDTSLPTYVHEAFTVSPTVCPLTYTYTETAIVNSLATTAIAFYDEQTKTFRWLYNGDDDGPIRPSIQKQTITVTATSGTKWGTLAAPPRAASDAFDLTFLDPCLDKDYTTIQATTQNFPTAPNSFDGVATAFTYTAYTTSPTYCA